MPLQGSVMTLEFWNLCNFLYSFENYLILIVSIVYPYIMLLHILISENFKLWAFWSLNTISWSTKCFLATGQFAYFGWVWYSYCCQNLAVFTEPCHTPAAGSCKTLVLLVFTWNARNGVSTSNKDIKRSTEAINWNPTPRTQLSGEVSYFFVSLSVGPPTLTNWKPATEI